MIGSSHDSANDGMTFEFSTDNTNWDDIYTFTYTAADGARRFQFPVTGRYFRVNYTNGGTAQTHFRLQTILHTQNQLSSIHRLSDDIDPDRSAQVMKTVLFAQAGGSGDFVALRSTNGGTFQTALSEYDGVDTNTGNASNSTLRVVLATDQPVVSVDDGAGSLTVDNGGTFGVQVDAALPAGDNNIGNVDIASSVALDVSAATVPVDLGANNDVTATGNVAHDAVDSGNPIKVGHKAIAHGANPTAVAANDRTDWYANRHGIPFVINGHPNIVTFRANYTTAQTDTAIVTIGAGNKVVVTRLSVTADNANTVDVQTRIGFGATTTPTGTGVLLSHPGIAAGSGVIEGSGAGILGVGGDGEDLRITSEVPTTGSIDVIVSYYTVES